MAERKVVKIGARTIGDGHPVCVVAELGVNHLGDFKCAKEMIHAAHDAGADLLKFQTYTAEKRYDTENNPKGAQFVKWLKEWELSREEEARLWEYAGSLGATVFTSAFDPDSVDFAEQMDTAAYKIAAFELVNLELVRSIAQKHRPVIFTRGMANDSEVQTAIDVLEEHNVPYIILHTISSYPTQKKDSHLRMIHTLRKMYSCPVGHSDHTVGTDIPPLAVAAGVNMIEKHFTITPKRRESDNCFSLTPEDLREMIWKVRQAENYMGSGEIVKIAAEEFMWSFRRHTS